MQDYLTRHRSEWEELEHLVRRANRRGKCLRGMTPEELSRLDVLYRRTAVHLAQVASRTNDAALIRYLNDLTAAAHSVIYLPARRGRGRRVWAFLAEGFPRAVARTWRFQAASLLLLVGGVLLGYVAVRQDPVAAYALMPAGEFRQPGAGRKQLLEVLRHGRDMGGGMKFTFASFLFSHNLKVGLLALATGVLAAVPTILLMLYNGMMLGAFTAVHHASGIYAEYWAWILPHGITELGAIVLCGGMGLQLGRAAVCPGVFSRRESLRRSGREVVRVVLGVACMLLVAAVVESYLRQSHLSTGARFVFAGGTLLFWTAYFAQGAVRERVAGRDAAAKRGAADNP